jgi:predicted ATPase/class 3 adenylate cyclase
VVGVDVPGDIGGGPGALAAGSRIAGYLLEEEIGAGGMAVVFRAVDERLDRPVALKLLAPGLAADEEFRHRFLRESRAAAAVDDPHIIPVYEAGQVGGVLFLAMRYVSGGDVRGLLRREGPLPAGRVAAIISPVACALDAAHGAGLVHRDVKPGNMLIDARPGRPDHVYLSDFGLAKAGAASALTAAGRYLGTAAYMAPEQIQGRAVDGRADQYALGCAAFELLCGGVPFERDQDVAVIYAHLSAPPPSAVSRRPDLPPVVDEVLARALAKAPGDRYASCGEFAGALRQALGLPGYDRDPGAVSASTTSATAGAGGATVIRPVTGDGDRGPRELPAGTITMLFSDIEGSTALLGRLGEAYGEALPAQRAIMRAAITSCGGREMGTEGDSFFVVFSSAGDAVRCCLDAQRALAARDWPGGVAVRVRMGLHAGEPARHEDGYIGLDVHRAARVAAVGYGGQVLLSEAAAALVRDGLPPGASLQDLGVHRLQDLGRPERIFQLQAAGLPAQFPPLRSLGNPALPNNLPAQLATFIGRDRELAEVRALVKTSRLVTLTGPGGSGKTRLGLQLAAGLLGGSGDGVWLADLAVLTDEDAVAAVISQALGIAAQPGRPVLETLLDALALQETLIVLDNCEHLIGGCAKTADAIVRRCPRVHLLATSREPLGIGGETIYRVPPMSLPGPGGYDPATAGSCDAVALFADRARAQGAGLLVDERTAPLVVSICARLDGLPLAIELAAARLRSLSLSDLHDRLDQRFRLLTGGSRTAPGRQQTLEATVEWSYDLLHGAEQVLLGRLSVFAEGFDLDAAEAVCGFGDIEVFEVADLLGSLVDKSLVVAEPNAETLRYRLLETIRQFAAEKLAEAGEAQAGAAAAAHCAHFLSVATAAAPSLTGPDQVRWLARLDTDQANLRRAAEHAASAPDGTAQVLRFGAALKRYRTVRNRDEEALALLPALDRPDARADPELFGAALVTAALAARGVDIAAARRLCEQAVTLARQLGTGRLLIESLAALSSVFRFAGEPERGLAPGREAVERARQLGDDVLLGESLTYYLLCDAVIDPAHATPLFTEALVCAQRSGDIFCTYRLTNNAGVHALRAGDIPAARAYLQQAAQAMRAIGTERPDVPINLGWVLRQDHDPDGARSSFQAALRMSRRTGDRRGLAAASLGLACLAADTGDWHRAAVLHGVAQAFLDPTGQPWEELEARYRRASLDQVRGHLGQDQFDRAHASGMALSFDETLNLASGKALPG